MISLHHRLVDVLLRLALCTNGAERRTIKLTTYSSDVSGLTFGLLPSLVLVFTSATLREANDNPPPLEVLPEPVFEVLALLGLELLLEPESSLLANDRTVLFSWLGWR